MDEDTFNMDMRKLLKQVGVTSQQQIEKAVWKALEEGQLPEGSELTARVTLEVDGPNGERMVDHAVDGRIRVDQGSP